MPGMTGLEVLEKIEKASISTDIIILSGYERFDYARKALKFQAKAYLLKPVDTEELRETLSQLRARRIGNPGGANTRISRTMLNDLADGKLIDTGSVVTLLTASSEGLADVPSYAVIFSFSAPVKEGTLSILDEAVSSEKHIFWNKV